jgi:hypothetical protein
MSAVADLIRQAQDAGVELRYVDGKITGKGNRTAVSQLIEPLRQHKADLIRWFTQRPANDPKAPPDPSTWRALAEAYHQHHFGCPTCIAGGQGRGLRCGLGSALWATYQSIV